MRFFVPKEVLLALMITALVFLAGCASKGVSLFDLQPSEGDVATMALADGKVTVTARYLDKGEQTAHLTALGREALGVSLRQVPLLTFLFTARNLSDEPLTVDPAGIRVATGADELLRPYSFAHLYLILPRDGGRQDSLQNLHAVAYERPVEVRPGGREEKLLLFRRPEVVGEQVTLLMDGLYLGGKGLEGVLVFKAVDLGK